MLKLRTLLTTTLTEIKLEVLAENVEFGKMSGYSKEWNINGENVSLGVEKIS